MTTYAIWVERPNADPVLHCTTESRDSFDDMAAMMAGTEHHFFVGGIYRAGTLGDYDAIKEQHVNEWLRITGQGHLV